jgi:dipeptidyl aminopeptidase/acylaminoacyl peptidase
VHVMNVDGTGVSPLTDDGRSRTPAWSPDGTRIAFLSWEPGSDIRHRDIYMMQADGTDRTRLTTDPAVEDHPTWAPDGTMILFARYRAHGVCELAVLSPGRAVGTNGPVAGASPEPTSERVLLSSEELGGCASDPSWQPIAEG